jgi:endonuclease III
LLGAWTQEGGGVDGQQRDHCPDRAKLEGRLLYSVIVAGKSAQFANNKVILLLPEGTRSSPLAWLARLDRKPGALEAHLRHVRTGRYSVLLRAFRWIIEKDLDLATVSVAELEACPGVGPKTARFFVAWTRPHERVAVLDVHILRWLRARGYDAPTSTPRAGELYDQLERAFIAEADERGKTPRELDLAIWEAGSTAANVVP